MKYILLILLTFLVIDVFSQLKENNKNDVNLPMNEQTKKYEFIHIDTVKGKTASELYQLAKEFLIKKFLDKDFFIDDENIKIGDNGNFPVTFKMPRGKLTTTYTSILSITIQFKDDRYKVVLTNFKLSMNANATTAEMLLEDFFKKNESVGMGKNIAIKMNNNIAESISKQVNLFFSDLKKYLNGIDVFSGNDEW